MSRTLFTVLAVASVVTACGGKSSEGGGTDPNAPKTEEIPKVPRVMGFEAGRALDSTKRISGGVRTTFAPTDTIRASVMTEHVGLGAKIEVALKSDTTTIEKTEALATAPDTSGKSVLGMILPPLKPWKLGNYQLQVLLDGKMQMAKEIEITRSGEAETETKAPAKAPAAKAPATAPAKAGTKAGSGGQL